MSDLGDFNLDQFKETYFEECNELLADAETRLMSLQQNPEEAELDDLHAIFRAVHSVKGGGGAFNFEQLVHFAHIYEALLDSMREEKVAVTQEAVDILLSANDILNNLIIAAREGVDLPEEDWADVAVELEALQSGAQDHDDDEDIATSSRMPDSSDDATSTAEGYEGNIESDAGNGVEGGALYKITFTPKPQLLQFGNEPLLLIRELKSLGEVKVFVGRDQLPSWDNLKHDEIYLHWVFFITTEKDKSDLEEVFEFVEFDCDLEITLAKPEDIENTEAEFAIGDFVADLEQQQAIEDDASDVKIVGETVNSSKVEQTEGNAVPSATPSSNVAVSTQQVQPNAAVKKAGAKQANAKAAAGGSSQKISSIRVDLDRVDKLVNMVGELVITQSMLQQQSTVMPTEYAQLLKSGFDDLAMHTRELQDSVMAIRMQPVKSVFARMPRLVRELSGKLGKKVDLVTSGENTEVDKTVVEQLADPLTHMIRNSLDHGLETEDERIDVGKPPRATVYLSAEHRGGRIQIDIADDGRGINREKVLGKAIEKGLVPENHNLSPEEVDELIFMPGFSTADEVTDVSGRGVGMDVVRRNIANLGGRISVSSIPGKGTRFNMSLPLTLAVLDGMVIAVGKEKYVIPLTAIVESIRPAAKDVHKLSSGGDVVYMRGEYIPLVYLYDLFGVSGAIPDPSKALVVIVELEGGNHAGIVVDDLLGQQQVVIKSLEDNYDPVAGVSAATILGNGLVALILDIDGLLVMGQGKYGKRHMTIEKQEIITETEQNYG